MATKDNFSRMGQVIRKNFCLDAQSMYIWVDQVKTKFNFCLNLFQHVDMSAPK